MKPLVLLGLAALLGLGQCTTPDPAPEDQLPPATQTGANTFGCLLNGQPWTPHGYNGTDNFRLVYDPGYHGGDLEIRAYRYLSTQPLNQYIFISGSPFNRTGTYPLDAVTAGAYYNAGITGPCQEYDHRTPGYRVRGQLVLTRLDQAQGVVSGTFAFTLSQPGCDSVQVTHGRFDKKR